MLVERREQGVEQPIRRFKDLIQKADVCVRDLARRDGHGRAAVQQGQTFLVLLQLFGQAIQLCHCSIVHRIGAEILRRLRELCLNGLVCIILSQHLRRDSARDQACKVEAAE